MRVLDYRAPTIQLMTTRAMLSIITIRAFSHSQLNELVVLIVCIRHDCSDGSAFYRYLDGSEYYRRKNGNLTFRLPEEPNENAEGADPAAALTPATTDRPRRPWYDWPPQLNLSLKTNGNSVIIRDASGLTVTFEPAGTNAGVDLVPVYNRSVSSFCDAANVDQSNLLSSLLQGHLSRGCTLGQEWASGEPECDFWNTRVGEEAGVGGYYKPGRWGGTCLMYVVS